jgi:hypothetical protein
MKRLIAGLCRLALMGLVLSTLLALPGCSGKTESTGGLMVIVTSDMPVPKDIDTVRIEIVRGSDNLYKVDFPLGTDPSDHQLPATLAVIAGSDPTEVVTIRVMGLLGPRARTLREAITTIPTDRVAALRMPIEFFCDGQVKQTADNIDTTCPKDQTCSEGVCVDAHVDSSTLPGYTPGDELRDAGPSDAKPPQDAHADADAGAPETSTGNDASSDVSIEADGGTLEAGSDGAELDAPADNVLPDDATSVDAPTDDAASDTGFEAGSDAPNDAAGDVVPTDAADASSEAARDAATDASADAGADASVDVAGDAVEASADADANLDAPADTASDAPAGPCTSSNFALATAGATASAQTTFSGYSAAHVNDGDRSTVQDQSVSWANDWNPPSVVLPQWFQIDFGATKTFSRIDIYGSTGYEIQDYDLQYWNGASWIDILQVRGNVDVHVVHQFAAVTGSKIQIIGRKGPNVQTIYTRLNEVEVCQN